MYVDTKNEHKLFIWYLIIYVLKNMILNEILIK